MSQPQRYDYVWCDDCNFVHITECPTCNGCRSGEYVLYSEYARIKEENECLHNWMNEIFEDAEGRLDMGQTVGFKLLTIKNKYESFKNKNIKNE